MQLHLLPLHLGVPVVPLVLKLLQVPLVHLLGFLLEQLLLVRVLGRHELLALARGQDSVFFAGVPEYLGLEDDWILPVLAAGRERAVHLAVLVASGRRREEHVPLLLE